MLDLLIVLVFVVYAVVSGFRSRRFASQGPDQYFLAGRTLSGWSAGTSMAATQFAADTPLLVTGLVATGGIFLLWRLTIYGLAFLLLAFVFAACWRRAGVLTDAELTEVRYSGPGVLSLRLVKALYYGTVINCVVLATVLVAATRIAEVFLPWHDWLPAGVYRALAAAVRWSGLVLTPGTGALDPVVATTDNLLSIVALLAFTTLYAATGGLRSVVDTDVVQFAVAMAGTAVYAWFVVREVGGLDALGGRVAALYGEARAERFLAFVPGVGDALVPFVAVVGLQWLFQMNADGTGYLAQRCMACRSDAHARRAAIVFAWLQIVLRSVLWLAIAVGLLVLYPYGPGAEAAGGFVAEREMAFVRGIDELLPPGARGLMLAGLLAALASTVDTHLNWGASYWSNDIYGRLVCGVLLRREPRPREVVRVARVANVGLLAVALAVMSRLGSIQEAWLVSLLFGAGLGGVLVLRWLWERMNLWGELAAMAVSLLAAPLLLRWFADDAVRLPLMAVLSTGAAVLAVVLTPPTDTGVLARFYSRVRPPGFWGRAAAAVGEDPSLPRRRLARLLATTGAAAVSLFGAFVGLGRLVVGGPEATAAGVIVPLGLAAAALPVWASGLRDTETSPD